MLISKYHNHDSVSIGYKNFTSTTTQLITKYL